MNPENKTAKKENVILYTILNEREEGKNDMVAYIVDRDMLLGADFPHFENPMNFRILKDSEREYQIANARRIYRFLSEVNKDYVKGSTINTVQPMTTKNGICEVMHMSLKEYPSAKIDNVLDHLKNSEENQQKLEYFFLGI